MNQNKIKNSLLGIVLLIILGQAICLVVTNFKSTEYVPGENSGGNTNPQVDTQTVGLSLGTIERFDMQDRYKELNKVYTDTVREYTKNNYTGYNPSNVYDLDKQYMNTQNILDIQSLSEIKLSIDSLEAPESYLESLIPGKLIQEDYIRYPSDTLVSEQDYVTIKVKTFVDGVEVNYYPDGYVQLIVGADDSDEVFVGMQDAVRTQKVGYKFTFEQKTLQNESANVIKDGKVTDEIIDISNKTIKYECEIMSIAYKNPKPVTVNDLKDFCKREGIDELKTNEELLQYVKDKYAWENGLNALDTAVFNVIMSYLPEQGDGFKFTDDMSKHLQLVINSVQDGYDVIGPMESELDKMLLEEAYRDFYKLLPDEYKHNTDDQIDIANFLSSIEYKRYTEQDVPKVQSKFACKEDFETYIMKLSLLDYVIDNKCEFTDQSDKTSDVQETVEASQDCPCSKDQENQETDTVETGTVETDATA